MTVKLCEAWAAKLEEAWAGARQAGVLGGHSVETFSRHADGFIIDDWRVVDDWRGQKSGGSRGQKSFVDIGTGAGLPGVLLALKLPSSHWTLVDSSERRCTFASCAVSALGLEDRVSVEHARVEELAYLADYREQFDGAAARMFGAATELAECGLPLLRTGGKLVVSVSARTKQQWLDADILDKVGCVVDSSWRTPEGEFMAIRRVNQTPDRLPRRTAARRRSPLF